jgi:hypothetical protein
MLVKIFQANGYQAIQNLEKNINEWSVDHPNIKHVNTAMCQVGYADSGERHQHYVVSVWYD